MSDHIRPLTACVNIRNHELRVFLRRAIRLPFSQEVPPLAVLDQYMKTLLASHKAAGKDKGVDKRRHQAIPPICSSTYNLLRRVQALTGDSSTTRINGRQELHPMQFAEEVLGFEDHRQSSSHNNIDRDSLASTSLFRGG